MSRSINIENYEEFALDFIEGTLSPEMHQSFEAFLLLHPAIAEEIESMQDFELPSIENELSDDFKQSLKIEIIATAGIDENNMEESFALAVDKDLNPELAQNALRFIDANPALANDFIAYQRTKVQPDLNVVYTEKSALKQPITLWAAYRAPILRVAAAVTIIIGLASALRNGSQEIYQPRSNESSQMAAIQIDPISTLPIKAITETEVETEFETSNRPKEKVYLAQNQPQEVQQISPLEPLNVDQVDEQKERILPEERYLVDATQNQFTEKEPGILAEAANTGKATVLNLTQFIGQRFFGIEPDKAETPKALIKESLNTFVDRNELMAVHTDGDKRTFAFAGGRFEYTKVAHQ